MRAVVLPVALLLWAACGGEDDPTPPPPPAPGVRVRGVDPETGERPACKVTITGLDGTPPPDFRAPVGEEGHVGVPLEGGVVATGRAALAARCDLVVPLAAGRYGLTVSAGPEREAARREVRVEEGLTALVEVELARTVDSTGWACADLHVHSAPSVDSDVPLDQRVLSALAEGLDLFVASDHDALGDWDLPLAAPEIEGRLRVIAGNELSPGVTTRESKGHFNVFPVPPGLVLPDAMPHAGLTVEQILAGARTAAPGALLMINHPRSDPFFGYFTLIDFDPVTGAGRAGLLASDFDLLEVWNGHGLDNGDREVPFDVVMQDWLSLVRAGRPVVATGASDTHRLARTPVGFPRTCARVASDDPAELDVDAFVEALRVGDAFVTSGPFLDVSVQDRGLGRVVVPGADGRVRVEVHAQAPAWVDVSRLGVLLDGDEVASASVDALPHTAVFDVEVVRDGFLVITADGDAPLGEPAGDPRGPMRSHAFTNPVFVDADGDGAWTPPARP